MHYRTVCNLSFINCRTIQQCSVLPFIHSSQINLIMMEDNTTNFRAPHRRVDHTYIDYSQFPLDRLPKDKKGSTNFPAKLHRILSNPEYSHVRHSLQTNIVGPMRSILHLIPINALILIHLFFFYLNFWTFDTYWIPKSFSDHIMDGKKIISHIVFCGSNPSSHLHFLYFVCTAAW